MFLWPILYCFYSFSFATISFSVLGHLLSDVILFRRMSFVPFIPMSVNVDVLCTPSKFSQFLEIENVPNLPSQFLEVENGLNLSRWYTICLQIPVMCSISSCVRDNINDIFFLNCETGNTYHWMYILRYFWHILLWYLCQKKMNPHKSNIASYKITFYIF